MRRKRLARSENRGGEKVVAAAFAYGFLNEPDRLFGVGHLVEHCLCRAIKRAARTQRVFGYIDDQKTVITFRLKGDRKGRRDVLGLIKEAALEIDADDVFIETRRLRSELESRYSEPIPLFTELVKGDMIASPKRLSRWRDIQLESIGRFDLKDVKRGLEALFSAKHHVFSASLSDDDLSVARTKPLVRPVSASFSKRRRFKAPGDDRMSAWTIAFPLPGFGESPVTSFALDFLSREIHARFERRMSGGSRESYYGIRTERGYGFAWFGVLAEGKMPTDTTERFFGAVDEISSDPDLAKKIERYSKVKAGEIERDWAKPSERRDMMIEDLAETGRVETPDESIRDLSRLTEKLVRARIRRYFSRKRARIWD